MTLPDFTGGGHIEFLKLRGAHKTKFGRFCLKTFILEMSANPQEVAVRIFQNGVYKDVYRRTIEIPQRTHISKANCCVKVHNVHLKLALPISG